MFFSWLFKASDSLNSPKRFLRSKSITSKSSLPASTLEKSRISLIKLSRASALELASSTRCICSSLKSFLSSKPSMPRMPFIGVRISWLILARNSALWRAVSSANSLAVICSCSTALRSVISKLTPVICTASPLLSSFTKAIALMCFTTPVGVTILNS